MSFPRLDLLVYAHDGRGLGHISRAAAVAMACRRIFPDLRVLLVTGAAATAQLIGSAPLDWLKLPAYATRVVDGKSTGKSGWSNYSDVALGQIRARTLVQIVETYRPRCVLVDHMPQGKHRELLPALTASKAAGSRWLLGIRGIVGDVAGVWSELARTTFTRNYRGLLWYADSNVLGSETPHRLQQHFSIDTIEAGYVSRMAEMARWQSPAVLSTNKLAGVIAIPWIGENSKILLSQLTEALMQLGPAFGSWKIFLPKRTIAQPCETIRKLQALQFCQVAESGDAYLNALSNCRVAVIYGGYNTLTDLLYSGTPAVVMLRKMQDLEQQIHARALVKSRAAHLILRQERHIQVNTLVKDLTQLLNTGSAALSPAKLNGAETTAKYVQRLIMEIKSSTDKFRI